MCHYLLCRAGFHGMDSMGMTWTRINKHWSGEEVVDRRTLRRIRQPKHRGKLSTAALKRVRDGIRARRKG